MYFIHTANEYKDNKGIIMSFYHSSQKMVLARHTHQNQTFYLILTVKIDEVHGVIIFTVEKNDEKVRV